MANVIKHKRGSGSDPGASDLVVGEVAIRTDVGKLFTKMDNGSVAEIAGGGSDIAINTLSSSSATGGGSATFNGSAYRFTLSQPPSVSAQQLLVSINGVIQKPVAGTGQPSEGFSVDGTDIILGDAPATGADFFILTFKSLGVSEPADNSVTSAKIVDGAIVNADINASAAIARTKLANVDLVDDTSPQLGGGLASNGFNINFADSNGAQDMAKFGNSGDLQIYHDGGHSYIDQDGTGSLYILADTFRLNNEANTENIIASNANGAVELYFDNSKKFETTNLGAKVTGELRLTDHLIMNAADNLRIYLGASNDLQIYHSSGDSYITNSDGNLNIVNSTDGWIRLQPKSGEEGVIVKYDGAVELYYDNSKKLETWNGGVTATGGFYSNETNGTSFKAEDNGKFIAGGGNDLQIYHDGSNSYLKNAGTGNIIFLSDDVQFKSDGGGNTGLTIDTDGAVQLFHNNVQMLSTASDGIQLQGDTKLSRHPNGNGAILAVTNAQYAKALFVGGWDGGTNSAGISRIRNSNDNLHIDSGSGGQIYLNGYSANDIFTRRIRPLTDNTFDLGSSSLRWDDVFATNGTIQTSDKTKKNTIVDSDLGLSFINKLKPVSYKFNDGTRTHYGLIAQDIETLLSDISKATTNFAGFIKTDHPDEYYEEAEPNIPDGKKEGDLKSAAHTEYGLRYTEFISPLIKAVQELAAKVEALEAK